MTDDRKQLLYEEVSNELYTVDELYKNTILRFNQTLEYYLEVPFANNICCPAKHDRIQFTDTTNIKTSSRGRRLLLVSKTPCNDRYNSGQITNFTRATKSSSLTPKSGATSLPLIGASFTYIETGIIRIIIYNYYMRISIIKKKI